MIGANCSNTCGCSSTQEAAPREAYAHCSLRSALAVAAAWLALLAASSAGLAGLGAIERMFLLAPLVVMPLGLRLVVLSGGHGQKWPVTRMARWLQPGAALLVVLSFLIPKGMLAAALTAPWVLFTVVTALAALLSFLNRGFGSVEDAVIGIGQVYLPIGGTWLLISRSELYPMGYREPIVLLTAVHFHYTAFSAPILAGLLGKVLRKSIPALHPLYTAAALGLVAGTPLLAVGFVFSPLLKLIAALLLAASAGTLCMATVLIFPALKSTAAKAFLVVSGAAGFVGMTCAALYACGEFSGAPLLDIPQMAVIHGVSNGLGFVLCGLLAWTFHFRKTIGDRGGELR